MSRTYRLRHEPSRTSYKFGDGRYTYHTDSVDSYWAAVIVHGIYGYPCDIVDDSSYELVEGPFSKAEKCISHHTICISGLIDDWTVVHNTLNKVAGIKKYRIANMSYHEYVRPGRRNKASRRIKNKCDRVRGHAVMRRLLLLNDLNDDWDASFYGDRSPYQR